ncbi:MAG TPA: TetR/AcrR family transcriptional regulator [Alphaproteobacteria bacterium]|nr:TetR/AcrR family transcriptional regulator [Alphaproteobacteria bacterium]
MRAALRVFAQKDFGDITLRDIQKASGFDAALIYYYFDDKQDLFDAAVKFALSEASGDSKLRLSADIDPVDAIRSWMLHCLALADSNRTIFRIMLHYAGSERGARALDRSIRSFYRREELEILARSIERGIAGGIFRKVASADVARFVSVHLDGITAASIVRADFDVAGAFRDLEAALWQQLGYAHAAGKFRSLDGGRSREPADKALDRPVRKVEAPVGRTQRINARS